MKIDCLFEAIWLVDFVYLSNLIGCLLYWFYNRDEKIDGFVIVNLTTPDNTACTYHSAHVHVGSGVKYMHIYLLSRPFFQCLVSLCLCL